MIKDHRTQRREIKVELRLVKYTASLDDFVDKLLNDIRIACDQREKPEGLKMEIIVE